jgi:hypothetical protein
MYILVSPTDPEHVNVQGMTLRKKGKEKEEM